MGVNQEAFVIFISIVSCGLMWTFWEFFKRFFKVRL